MWSYVGPSTGMKDQLRFAVGDTYSDDPLLQDEELTYLLAQADYDVSQAAVYACDAIISKLARFCDETVGSVSIALSQKRQGYVDRLDGLKVAMALNGDMAAYAGGISHRDKAQVRSNPDWERPDFSHDMMRSPFVRPLVETRSTVRWETQPWT